MRWRFFSSLPSRMGTQRFTLHCSRKLQGMSFLLHSFKRIRVWLCTLHAGQVRFVLRSCTTHTWTEAGIRAHKRDHLHLWQSSWLVFVVTGVQRRLLSEKCVRRCVFVFPTRRFCSRLHGHVLPEWVTRRSTHNGSLASMQASQCWTCFEILIWNKGGTHPNSN